MPHAVDTDDVPEVPRTARGNPGDRVLEDDGAGGLDPEQAGAGLPRNPSRAVTTPSTRTSIRSAKPPAAITCSPLADAVTTAVAKPASFTAFR